MPQQSLPQGLSALLLKLYDLPLTGVKNSEQFQILRSPDLNKTELLLSIPAPAKPSQRPLHLLYTLLTEIPGQWPTIDLIKCQARLIRLLPKDGEAPDGSDEAAWTSLIDATSQLIKRSYEGFLDFLSCDDTPALRSTNARNFITHRGLNHFVKNFRLPIEDAGRKPTVAIALPNGPLLAASCIAVTTYYTAAPINPAAGPEQFRADIEQSGAAFILTTPDDYERLQLGEPWVQERKITVLILSWDHGDNISVRNLAGDSLPNKGSTRKPNHADDIGLVLFTSGTSGTKKVVPLTTHSIIAGIVFVMESWGLSSDDICLNMMPLYHVGGLVRNIFAPMFSGGSTVCCSAFDPNLFWDVVEDIRPTWYYASPSMHSVILSEAASRPQALAKSRIRLACNAAGGLLPSLACQLRDTFECVVLPSYGMTECMPISTPPLDYKLDREGTSGISTGPQLTILDWSEEKVSSGTVGRICVRGEPVFPGYLRPDGSFDKSPFNPDDWFDTGDLGYMDEDGYLYITGRSKEVINRGGELISPFEVENAIMCASLAEDSPISGRVTQALAFSAGHDVLQEVVAVVLVSPPNSPRVDLKTLHSALRSSLQQVKWPVLITYMDDVPKKNNKVLRIKLGQRLGLPDLTDDTPYLERHWEAICPAPDTALSVPIESSPCSVDYDLVASCFSTVIPPTATVFCRKNPTDGAVEAFLAPSQTGTSVPEHCRSEDVKKHLGRSLDNYLVPSQIHIMPNPLPRGPTMEVDEARLQKELNGLLRASLQKLEATTIGRVTMAFADTLSRPPADIPADADFFSLGGDSLRAGRLLSALRNMFNVQLPISLIFNEGTVTRLAAHIDKLAQSARPDAEPDNVVGCTETKSSTNPLLMLIQLIPLVLVYPLRRAFQWTVFIVGLSYSQDLVTNKTVPGRLFNLTVCILIAKAITRCVAPFVGMLAKWIIIGRYKEGLYPMWGFYHTRWWMVQKIVSICGKGFFNFNDGTKRIYCRMMGAKIGRRVKLSGAALGEWDLLDIRDGAELGRCTCRPFAAEGNTTMYLGRIVIGESCSVGTSSIIAPGSVIPPNTCIGLNSSSWEMEDADETNRDLAPSRAQKPHWLLVCLLTVPLALVAWFLALIPWMGGLIGMVLQEPMRSDSPMRDILAWFTGATRVGYHYLALILRASMSPFILFGFTVLIKKILDAAFGELGPSPPLFGEGGLTPRRGTSQIATWRASLIKTLCPGGRLHDVTGMFGQHYEATSVAIRMLGGKVGQRVYWPGTGPSIGDYHLVDIGNDVVFGSRAHLITTDGHGSEKITIKDRAMIADRVCLLPGVQIGERTTMGSGALARRFKTYPAGGTYVGSKGRDAVCLSTGRDLRGNVARRSRIRHLSSIETLTAGFDDMEMTDIETTYHHRSSEETLVGARSGSKKHPIQVMTDQFTPSDSDSESVEENTSIEDMSPFGRAFYLKLAPYRVLGPFSIFCYSSFLTIFTAFYWNVSSVTAIQFVYYIIATFFSSGITFWYDVLILFGLTFGTMAVLMTVQAILALAMVIVAKWALLGRRMPGNYDWDKSPYCQRWQIFLCIEKLRRQCYRGNGVLGMLTGTHWIVLYFRILGARIGKDCALFANGQPSLMFTEPDLITLGDRVVVDDASVVGHINTRGKFDLNRLEIGDRCVLRTGSRLLSGATMKNDSCLLEHTLIMGGDVVEERWTMQGWPAERFTGQRTGHLKTPKESK